MGTLLYLLLIAGVFFVMMRFGCGAHVMGHGGHEGHDRAGGGAGGASGGPAPDKAVDPVCGMSVDTATARSAVYRGRPYWFCSAEHRDQFEAAPERYAMADQEKEHSHAH
ncbi:conserved exported hypothetical protein [Thiomonas arsenitoxydans]|uniref:Cation transporting P-type ATPase n=3 Tax=Thiomonas TaxID=32012 RepID=A0A238D768_THIDL|nr:MULTISPECIES: YHS domain-containing protein [Thiomonas]CQR45671.1 conserved exported hypothetical protein [Thiomonas sp. CB3]VDY06843.1 conserved protein of unknown function [Thiomonas sp. Bio17B3]VDY09861.1 conserved protein of unknown function [Thiomonas sp. Sup16B3]CDW96203.1 Cation transporting P-type ATPase [Thiomonas sp. CB2]CQR31395.1 conserved exported hypothetical protein [Thiomonas arsenitoxydans]